MFRPHTARYGNSSGLGPLPPLFDLFLNALSRLLNATGITHGIKRTPQWNHAAFADDLSIYVGTVRDWNKMLEVIHEFESWSGLRISIPKSVATGAMYGSGTTRRQEEVKADVAKRKRDAGPDILEPQIRALEAMDEALRPLPFTGLGFLEF